MSSKHYSLKAETRDRAGKGIARALRRENKIPAVIYGDGKEPVKIVLDSNTMNVEYRRGHMFTSVCDMEVEGKSHMVLARDIQLHPVTDNVIHADFLRVTSKTKIAVFIPVNFINEDKSPGLRDKGTLSVVRYEVELVCSAMNIPDHIDVNLEGKEQGDIIHISDATLPEGTKPVIERNFTIATLLAPKSLAAIEAEEAAEAAASTDPAAVPASEVSEEGEDKAAEGKKEEGKEKE